jgi:hypothetical protein
MSSNHIEGILGKGESVDACLVLRAMGAQLGTKGEPYESAEGGLWVRWKGKDHHTIYVQYGGPEVVKKVDGSYAVGPNTRCCLVLFITEQQPRTMRFGQTTRVYRDIEIYFRLAPRHGYIHTTVQSDTSSAP